MTQVLFELTLFGAGFCAGGLFTVYFWRRSLDRLQSALDGLD